MLKLMALDEDDLRVVSAHVQDAVFKPPALSFERRGGQFSLAMNRFVWETASEKRKAFERRSSVLLFKRVLGVRSAGFDRAASDTVLSLLAISFRKTGEGPEGVIELALSDHATIALDVECIEVQLADTGGAWETGFRPRHPAAE